jgi:hypothetical protein
MMYKFVCTGTPEHHAYSASEDTAPCPICGAPLRRVSNAEASAEPKITAEETIWFPGIYSGRQGDYAKLVMECSEEQIIALVQQRAKEDGEWAIENGFVGDNEDVMRKMIKWVSDETNIRQAMSHLTLDNGGHTRTVDWICRDLANAAKWIGGSRD